MSSDVGLTYQGQIKSEGDLCPPINTHPDGVTGNKGPWLQEAWRVDSTLIWSSFLPLVPPTPPPTPPPPSPTLSSSPPKPPTTCNGGEVTEYRVSLGGDGDRECNYCTMITATSAPKCHSRQSQIFVRGLRPLLKPLGDPWL